MVVDEINISEKKEIEGDRYKGNNKKRQVTIIQAEHIEAVSKMLQIESIDPALLRRNIVVSELK